MRSSCTFVPATLALLSCLGSCAYAQPPHVPPLVREASSELPPDEIRMAELYSRVLPAVVAVMTRQRVDGSVRQGLGTGVLVSPACHVLTAAHVVSTADSIVVKTQDGKLRPAEVLVSEPAADIALLRLTSPDLTLPHAVLGDSDRLAVGQRPYIIGNPRGLENSLSVGRISGFREFGRLYDGSILTEFIQTDAAINSGNSGGPAFDSLGQVIGIASRISTLSGGSEGLGFVVSINTAKQLLALEDRAWTGIEAVFLDAKQMAGLLNLDQPGGLLVQRVAKSSPAARAGLRGGSFSARVGHDRIILGGDLILQIGDQQACHSQCLAKAHRRFVGMDKIPIHFLRGGKMLTTVVDVSATRRNFLKDSTSNR